jgi:site-specific DNA-methyltransferase (adenine-specific)
MDLTKLSKPELLAKCQELGILKCKSKNKSELIQLINNNNNKHIVLQISNNSNVNYNIKTMRYLGNKTKHLEFIYNTFLECVNKINLDNPIIFDAFGGTGSVTHFFNINNYSVVSNDLNNYSYKLCYARNSITIDNLLFNGLKMDLYCVIDLLNTKKHKGFVYYNYSPNKELKYERKYFTNENAETIDGIRQQIQVWKHNEEITDDEYIFLVALLIENVSLYSNIPGTYGAFNIQWDSRSTRKFELDKTITHYLLAKNKYKTYNEDIKTIIDKVECDVLYIDPPYNERDYSSYYHVLETISMYDNPEINENKTGTKKNCKKSKWCSKSFCKQELEYIIKNTKAKCIIMSYNNEGIMTIDEIKEIYDKYGDYLYKTKLVKRFKCNSTETDTDVYEYLHILFKKTFHEKEKKEKKIEFIIEEEKEEVVLENEIIGKSNVTKELVIVNDTDSEYNNIYNCCCLSGMIQLSNNVVDLICTDLPYGLTECKWDTPINLDNLWKEYKRVLKPYGTIILFGQQPFTSRLVSSNYEMFKYSLVWNKSKPGGFAQAPYKVLCEHEDILIFSYGKTSENAKNKMVYNPQGTLPCNKVMKGKTGTTEHRNNRKTQDDYVQTTSNYPRSILKFNNEGKTQHPTQKPIELIKYLIKTFSNENDLVLDSCMGSGTTAVACIETNRMYVGYELDTKYYNICKERIQNHTL